jgi:uncharacterized protein (DUF2147 family)
MKTIQARFKHFFVILLLALFTAIPAHADNNSPIGYWQVYDENTNQPTSVVQIWNNNGKLQGKVVKLFGSQDAVCTECSGAMQNKPVLGMVVLWGFTQEDDGWKNGKVLAVKRGKVYNANLTLNDSGQKLAVQVSVFGTKHVLNWTRVD